MKEACRPSVHTSWYEWYHTTPHHTRPPHTTPPFHTTPDHYIRPYIISWLFLLISSPDCVAISGDIAKYDYDVDFLFLDLIALTSRNHWHRTANLKYQPYSTPQQHPTEHDQFWEASLCHVMKILCSDWSVCITWCEYCVLIGWHLKIQVHKKIIKLVTDLYLNCRSRTESRRLI